MKPSHYYDGENLNLARYVPESAQRILEIGCAGGGFGAWLKKQQPCEYWGLELNAEAASEATSKLDRLIEADIELLDMATLPEQYFDCVIFGDVLEHLSDPERILRDIRQCLTHEAILVANVPNVAHWSVIVEQLKGDFRYADSGLLDRTHRTFFTPRSFQKVLWRSGFIQIDSLAFTVTSDVVPVLTEAAKAIGVDPDLANETLTTYQFLVQAKLQPRPHLQQHKRAVLTRSKVPLDSGEQGAFSIIIVTFQSATTIEECIVSLLRTKGPRDEIIIVDNGSSDLTTLLVRRLVERDQSIKLIENGENIGFSKANNVGVMQSKGELILYANPDTVFFEGWRNSFSRALENVGCGAVGPLSDIVGGMQHVGRWPELRAPSPSAVAKEVRRFHDGDIEETQLLIGFCLAMRRDVLDDVGLFDEAMFLGAEDLELSWRLGCLGYKLLIALDAFVQHKHHVSFKSMQESEAQANVRASDKALIRKLEEYYDRLDGINSDLIWNSPIFGDALS